ncbi:MAG: hypothetical protein U9R11_04270 [Chloroflexota bacterium]|nr:hypothetical protein [Chloroflexota bacterium]
MASRSPSSLPIDHRPAWRSIVLLVPLLMGLMLFLSVACAPSRMQVQLSPTAVEETRSPPARYRGRIAFKSDRDGEEAIYVMNSDGSGQTGLEDESVYYDALKYEPFSPDRSQVVFVRLFQGNYDIFVRNVRGNWIRQLTTGSYAEHEPAWSPDGALVAYVSESEGTASIWVTDAAGEESRRLTNPSQRKDRHPSWSPDSDRIAFCSDRGGHMEIWLMDAEGSNQRNISRSKANDWDPVWIKAEPAAVLTLTPTPGGPDDLGIGLAVSGYNLYLSIGDNSGGYAPITRAKVLVHGGELYDSGPMEAHLHRQTISLEPTPGARQVEVRAWNKGYYATDAKVVVREIVCAEPTPPTPTPTPGPTSTPTPTPIVVTPVPTPEDVFAAATRVARLGGTPTLLPPNMVTPTPTPRFIVVTSTPTPANVATAQYRAALATAQAVTTGTPTPTPPYMVTATSTPVLVYLNDEERLSEYVSMSTPEPTPISTPTLTAIPDVLKGKIAFKSDRYGGERIYIMDPDGSHVALLTDSWAYEVMAELESKSQDGRFLVYQDKGPHGLDLFLHDLLYDTVTPLTRVGMGDCYDAAWSPDNYHIAFASNQEGDDEIFIVPREGGVTQLTKNKWEWDKHPSYSPDGERIVYYSNAGTGHDQIWVMDADGSGKYNISNNQYNEWDPIWIKGFPR